MGKYKLLKISILAAFAFMQIACSENNGSSEGSSTSSSRVEVSDDNDATVSFLSECSPFQDQSLSIKGLFNVYRRPGTNAVVSDYMYTKLSNWPAELGTSATHYIQIFRWTADNGYKEINNTPTNMFFVNHYTGVALNENSPVNNLSKGTLETIINQHGLASQSVNAANFFSIYAVVLKNVDLQFDAVTVAAYDSSMGSTAIGSTDILLPAYAADPNKYAQTHIGITNILHPLYDRRNSGLTEKQHQEELYRLCDAAL